MTTFAEWLRDQMEQRGLLQEDVVEMIGVRQSTVSAWLRLNRTPDFQHIVRLARALGVPIGDLADLLVPDNVAENRQRLLKERAAIDRQLRQLRRSKGE